MIGNDVIDLLAAKQESNWERKGFLQKLFCANEREIIFNYPDPEVMVWILWSMKEAAYKAYNRQTGIRTFIPHCLDCSINIKTLAGTVTFGKYSFFTRTVVKDSMINTLAVTHPDHFDMVAEISGTTVLKDENELPYILTPGFQSAPVSVSHHGRFKKIVGLFAQPFYNLCSKNETLG